MAEELRSPASNLAGQRERTHTNPARGQVKSGRSVVPESKLIAGRFGRMFRNLPSYEPSDDVVDLCVNQMAEAPEEQSDNQQIPAGFTYLGQFIDHDLTFDPVSSLQRQNDPDGLRSFRTPVLDLDALYGLGPDDQPYLYQKQDSAKLLVGQGESAEEEDLPRNVDERALIGDPRNDENIIVAQLHLAFIKLHNQLVDDIRAAGANGRPDLRPHVWPTGDIGDSVYVFREAQRLTRWHYQWIVLSEFLPKMCGQELIGELVEQTPIDGVGTRRKVKQLEYYKPEQEPFIPVEWSVAAYRYGHSQIRPTYNLNRFLAGANADIPIFIDDPATEPLRHLAGGRKLPGRWTLDWRFFFEQNAPGIPEGERAEAQKSRLLDSKLAPGLQFLPGMRDQIRSLARRNLLRGRAMGLPSGQAVARRMSVQPLTSQQLGLEGAEAPLWFYILKEAELAPNNGVHLGSIGGRIVAEVILGILKEDPFCFLRTEPAWQPVLPAPISGNQASWGMADLLSYAVPNDGRRF